MTDDTVRIPVDVDTRKAKADIRQLNRDKVRAKKRVSDAARRTSRMAARAFAFSGAASAIGKLQNEAPNGNVSPFEEALVPYLAAAQHVADRELGFSGKAPKSAREQTKAAFAYHVGRTGELTGMRDFFNTVSKIQEDVESGRNIIRRDPRFSGPGFGTIAEVGTVGYIKLFLENANKSNPFRNLLRGFDYVVDGITAE